MPNFTAPLKPDTQMAVLYYCDSYEGATASFMRAVRFDDQVALEAIKEKARGINEVGVGHASLKKMPYSAVKADIKAAGPEPGSAAARREYVRVAHLTYYPA